MNDPYKILNIAPTATDDEVKHAYRQLARKYHPDNYHDNPLADLAQEKMKEINEAYEQILRQRKNGASHSAPREGGYASSSAYESGSSYESYGASGGSVTQQIRLAINRGDISRAEQLLGAVSEHDAEWNFLMGVVCARRGWLDEAKRYLENACRMDPSNGEYRGALEQFTGADRYRPAGYRSFGTMTYGGDNCLQYCATMALCNLCCPGAVCIPC